MSLRSVRDSFKKIIVVKNNIKVRRDEGEITPWGYGIFSWIRTACIGKEPPVLSVLGDRTFPRAAEAGMLPMSRTRDCGNCRQEPRPCMVSSFFQDRMPGISKKRPSPGTPHFPLGDRQMHRYPLKYLSACTLCKIWVYFSTGRKCFRPVPCSFCKNKLYNMV